VRTQITSVANTNNTHTSRESACKLIPSADIDMVSVVFHALQIVQLFKQNGDLLTIRCAQRIELQWMLATLYKKSIERFH
jgi:hypothetical protein